MPGRVSSERASGIKNLCKSNMQPLAKGAAERIFLENAFFFFLMTSYITNEAPFMKSDTSA